MREGRLTPLSVRVQKIVRLALLMATALILSYVESVLELNIVVPGVKIGIGNVLLTYVLYEYGFPTAAGFGLTRSFLSMLFLGRLSSAIFSLTGMVFAVLAMGAANKCGLFSPLGVNVSGSVLHVFGQLLAAAFVTETASVLGLLPVYVCVSVVCGVLTYIPLIAVLKFEEKRRISTGEISRDC